MTIVYHGDHYGTTNLDPRWMIHEKSTNDIGIGIYFTPDIEYAKEYGPKICSIDISKLKIAHAYDDLVQNVISKKIHNKFVKYLSKKCQFDEKEFNKLNKKIDPEDRDLAGYQINIYKSIEKSKIIDFVKGWNKIIKIDGLYLDKNQNGAYDEYCIIQTNVKVTPVNF